MEKWEISAEQGWRIKALALEAQIAEDRAAAARGAAQRAVRELCEELGIDPDVAYALGPDCRELIKT